MVMSICAMRYSVIRLFLVSDEDRNSQLRADCCISMSNIWFCESCAIRNRNIVCGKSICHARLVHACSSVLHFMRCESRRWTVSGGRRCVVSATQRPLCWGPLCVTRPVRRYKPRSHCVRVSRLRYLELRTRTGRKPGYTGTLTHPDIYRSFLRRMHPFHVVSFSALFGFC